ncbi:Drug/metabolite transporter [Heracleum sosnowskyi]|uniref:WAT1-related protein n=1 Tax=Heracleum sosnowskyi TaxID=360622 RepID=A0AAD8HET3_9APIA|nr:Drug/metabolite transporter [Heracleum sosnowskyi]
MSVLPFTGMVIVQVAMVGQMVTGKQAMLDGMTNFTFVFYFNALSFLILLFSLFLFPKSNNLPPLTYALVWRCILFGILGFATQITGYTGIQYASATLASSMLNLIPGFTFILTIIFRLEKADFRSSSAQAKLIGTVVSILGAFIVTLYEGPRILKNTSSQNSTENLTQSQDWILGGLLLAMTSLFASLFIIAQALILKKHTSKLVVSLFYSSTIAILSALLSLMVEKDFSSWSLQSNIRIMAVIYAGLFGASFQVTVSSWCMQRTGPLFVVMFHPLGIIISSIIGVTFLGDAFYLGSLVGSIVIIFGVYTVIWGIAKERKVVEATSITSPLLQDNPNVEDTTLLAP